MDSKVKFYYYKGKKEIIRKGDKKMKKIILALIPILLVGGVFIFQKKTDTKSLDDVYYVCITQEVSGDTYTVTGYNGGKSELTFEIPVEEWNMTQYKEGNYIKIGVNKKDEILQINRVEKEQMPVTVLEAIGVENK